MASAREGAGCSRGSKYDVFLSFRGPDTRHGFVDCLYMIMINAGIRVFLGNERLHVGEVIGEELMRAIDDSKICMPVFSKSYASSKWCLLELEYIMKDRPGQEVMPVFYDVSPEDVKLRTRLYSDDLEVLKKEHGNDAVDRWRECLKKVCKIKGWNLEESKGQAKMIQRIVEEFLYKTKKRYKNITEHLVGIDGGVEAMMELLDDRIDHVRFVIIHGVGGIGKTTLAKVIFNDVSSNFQGCRFLSNVRESSQGNGIVKLQQQILNDVLRMSVSIPDVDDGVNEIRERCCHKRVLLVLDDADELNKLENWPGCSIGLEEEVESSSQQEMLMSFQLDYCLTMRKARIKILNQDEEMIMRTFVTMKCGKWIINMPLLFSNGTPFVMMEFHSMMANSSKKL